MVGHHAKKEMVWLMKTRMFEVKTSKSINLVVKLCCRPRHIYSCAYFWVEHLMSNWLSKCKGILLSFWCLKKCAPPMGTTIAF